MRRGGREGMTEVWGGRWLWREERETEREGIGLKRRSVGNCAWCSLQGTWAGFPAPMWWFTIDSNFISMGPGTTFWLLGVPGILEVDFHTGRLNPQTHKIKMSLRDGDAAQRRVLDGAHRS